MTHPTQNEGGVPLSLTKLFQALTTATQDARSQLVALQSREEQLRRERDLLRSTPPSKDDVKRLLRSWVDAAGADYTASLQSALAQFIRRPESIPEGAPRLELISPVGAVQPFGAALSAQDLDRVLAALFRDQLLASLLAAVDAMTWEEGEPLSKRTGRAQQLDAAIANLQAEQASLVDEARAAGVDMFARG